MIVPGTPTWPWLLLPQAQTVPSSLTAKEKFLPDASFPVMEAMAGAIVRVKKNKHKKQYFAFFIIIISTGENTSDRNFFESYLIILDTSNTHTKGTVPARRPPNKNAEIGTPSGFSQSGSITGH